MITQSSPRWIWPKAGLAASIATMLVVLACETPLPAAVDLNDDGTATGVSQVVAESDVDVRPTRLSGPPARYPEMLRQAGVEGVVLLDFIIDATGRVDSSSLTVVRSTNRAFEGPSMEVIRRSMYTPGENDGIPVAVRVQQQIGFSIAAEPKRMFTTQLQLIREGQSIDFEQPTVYVDGVRYEGSMAALNADDIARVEVLKGAAAVALYGPADTNGVIQIFTKQADIQVTGRRGN